MVASFSRVSARCPSWALVMASDGLLGLEPMITASYWGLERLHFIPSVLQVSTKEFGFELCLSLLSIAMRLGKKKRDIFLKQVTR